MNALLITIRELFLHPRNVVDAFLTHQKRNFIHPFKLLLAVTLFVLTIQLLASVLFLDLPAVNSAARDSEQVVQIQMWVETVSRSMITLFLPVSSLFLLIPALSVSGLVFFRKELTGFYENLILNTYTVAVSNLFSLLWLLILLISPDLISNSAARTFIAITVLGIPILWIYQRYFVQKTPIKIIRQLSTAASGFILYIILSGFISGVLGYMLFAVRRIAELSGQ